MDLSPPLSRRECGLVVVFTLLSAIAVFGPARPTPARASAAFADTRAWRGLPNAMDVLSNLPFAAIGVWGLLRLRRLSRLRKDARKAMPPSQRTRQPSDGALEGARMFFAGLILTAAGSVFYHLQPDAMRLAVDRAGMSVAFAGILGIAVCDRVSARAGRPAAWFMLVAGLLAAGHHLETANVLPWALVQFGGMAVILALALAKPSSGALGVRLGQVIVLYGLAKLFELWDQAIFDATRALISGHTLKHLTAALAALPVLRALARQSRRLDAARAAAPDCSRASATGHWSLRARK